MICNNDNKNRHLYSTTPQKVLHIHNGLQKHFSSFLLVANGVEVLGPALSAVTSTIVPSVAKPEKMIAEKASLLIKLFFQIHTCKQ